MQKELCWKMLQGQKGSIKENICFSNLYYFNTLGLKHLLTTVFSLVVLIFLYLIYGTLNINETCIIIYICMYIKVEEKIESYYQQAEELHKFIYPNWLVVLFGEIFNVVV